VCVCARFALPLEEGEQWHGTGAHDAFLLWIRPPLQESCGEGAGRQTLDVFGQQMELLDALVASNSTAKLIVVLIHGASRASPHTQCAAATLTLTLTQIHLSPALDFLRGGQRRVSREATTPARNTIEQQQLHLIV